MEDDGQHDVDPARANEYLGKTILVGITYIDHNGEVVEQRQWHGIIEDVDPLLAIRIAGSDDVRTLPPRLAKASPGEYRLRSTGEVVIDPDFLATWEVNAAAPPPHDRPDSYMSPGTTP